MNEAQRSEFVNLLKEGNELIEKRQIILFAIVLLLVVSLSAERAEAKNFLNKVGDFLGGAANIIAECFGLCPSKDCEAPVNFVPIEKNLDKTYQVRKIEGNVCYRASSTDSSLPELFDITYELNNNDNLIKSSKTSVFTVNNDCKKECADFEVDLSDNLLKKLTDSTVYPAANKVALKSFNVHHYTYHLSSSLGTVETSQTEETRQPISNTAKSQYTFTGPILIYTTGPLDDFNALPNKLKGGRNIEVEIKSKLDPTFSITGNVLAKYSQLWILNNGDADISQAKAAVKSFYNNGGGLFIASHDGFVTNFITGIKKTAMDFSWEKFTNTNIDQNINYAQNIAEFIESNPYENKILCEHRGGKWTGSSCCGLADKENKDWYYNDPSGSLEEVENVGGCWNNKFVKSGTNPSETLKDAQGNEQTKTLKQVINVNGEFNSCKDFPQDFPLVLDGITGYRFYVKQIVPLCGKITASDKTYKCKYNGEFDNGIVNKDYVDLYQKSTGWEINDALKAIKEHDKDLPEGCCSADECFDGKENCADKNSVFPHPLTKKLFFCTKDSPKTIASWDLLYQKSTPDDKTEEDEKYYCKQQSQCLLMPREFSKESRDGDLTEIYSSTLSKRPHCINSGQFVDDRYCDNGQWTSRTKFLIGQLMDYGGAQEFELSCGKPSETLNDFSGTYFGSFDLGREYRSLLKTNNVCVLKSGNNVLFGATLNAPINTKDFILGSIAGVQSNVCDNTINSNNFGECASANNKKVFYNPSIKSVIFSPHSKILTGNSDFSKIETEFNSIKSKMVEEYEFAKNIKYFDTIFYQQKADKKIFGFLEKKIKYAGKDESPYFVMGIKYASIENPLDSAGCASGVAENLKSRVISIANTDVKCEVDGNSIILLLKIDVSQDDAITKENKIKKLWKDLTQKLRLI